MKMCDANVFCNVSINTGWHSLCKCRRPNAQGGFHEACRLLASCDRKFCPKACPLSLSHTPCCNVLGQNGLKHDLCPKRKRSQSWRAEILLPKHSSEHSSHMDTLVVAFSYKGIDTEEGNLCGHFRVRSREHLRGSTSWVHGGKFRFHQLQFVLH